MRAITGALLMAMLIALSLGGALCGASCVSGSVSNAFVSGMPAAHACCPSAASNQKDRSSVTNTDACGGQPAGDAAVTVAAVVVPAPVMMASTLLPAPVADAVSTFSARPLMAAASPPVVPLRI